MRCFVFFSFLALIVKGQYDWHLDVQSKFVEDWNGADQSMHMIAINAGEKMDGVIRPLNASDSVSVMVNHDVDISVPVSGGEKIITLRRLEPVQFSLNEAGRFSFVVVLEGEKNLDLPEFLVRSDYMGENEWLVVMPDHDSWDRLSRVDADTLRKAHPSINPKLAQSVSVFVAKLSSMAKSARLDLRDDEFVIINPNYNQLTNRLPSYFINLEDVDSVSTLVAVPMQEEFLVSYGQLSQMNSSIMKREQGHQSEHSQKAMDFYWNALDTLNSDSGLNFSDITNEIDLEHMAVTSEPKSSKMMVMFQKRGLNEIYHAIIDTTKGIFHTIQLVLRRVGIILSDLLKHLRGHFRWESISRTARFLIKYHRVFGAFQSYGFNFTQKLIIEKKLGNAVEFTQNSFDGLYTKLGAKRVNDSMFGGQEKLKVMKDSTGLDDGMSTGDARVNYLQDRIMASIQDVEPVNDVSFRHNIKKLFRLGTEMGKELTIAIPKEHREKLRGIVLEFDDDSFFFGRMLARAMKLVESIAVFVEEVFIYVVKGLSRFLNLLIQISTTLLELPVYIPVFSSFWAKFIAPGTGEMSLLSIYCLIGAIPSALFYHAYRGLEPFSVNDIKALETVKIPQLFIYTWNTHELTRTSDPHELKRRNAVFDWITKMSGAYMTSANVVSSFAQIALERLESKGVPNPVVERKYYQIGKVANAIRWLGVLLMMIWIYPFSQLPTADPIAIENDMKNPEPRTLLWWSVMQIGISLRLITLAADSVLDLSRNSIKQMKALSHADDARWVAATVIAPMQLIAAGTLSKEIIQRTNIHNWKRTTVSTIAVSAFAVDTVNQFLNFFPCKWKGFENNKDLSHLQLATAAGLQYGYELRSHAMMSLHVVGLFAPANETLADHKPDILANGDITKLVIRPGDKRPIQWEKGMNALFHYNVHAYVPSHVLTHKGSHDACCSSKSKAQKIMEMVEQAKGNRTNDEGSESLNSAPVRYFVADSRQHDPDNPFELRIGYSFSVKAMELCVKSMSIGEKSRFLCQNEYTTGYSQLEMALRKEKQNKINIEKGLPVISNHVCSAHADTNFMDTLVDLQKIDGYPLEYEIELLQVLKKGEYLLEPWEMTVSQRYEEALRLKESGNSCYKIADTKGALGKYTRALTMIESLASAPEIVDAKREMKMIENEKERKEWLNNQEKRRMIKKEIMEFNSENTGSMTDDVGMNFTIQEMEALDITLRLNFCACQLKLGGFNQVIIQCSEILKRDPDNLKAFFRRCQAYCNIGRDLDLAENDCKSLRLCLARIDKDQKRSEWSDLRKMEQNINQKLAHHQEKEKQLFAGIFKS